VEGRTQEEEAGHPQLQERDVPPQRGGSRQAGVEAQGGGQDPEAQEDRVPQVAARLPQKDHRRRPRVHQEAGQTPLQEDGAGILQQGRTPFPGGEEAQAERGARTEKVSRPDLNPAAPRKIRKDKGRARARQNNQRGCQGLIQE